MKANEIELLAGIALEDGGISLPLRTVFGKILRVTMRTPSTRSLIRISRKYLEIGVTPEEFDAYNFDQLARFHLLYSKDVSRMVAYGIVRGPIFGRLLNRPVAWLLRNLMTGPAITEAWRQILNCISTTSFGNIIASAAAINKMQPLASRNESEEEKSNEERS